MEHTPPSNFCHAVTGYCAARKAPGTTAPQHSRRHGGYCGVRVGEASHPGPPEPPEHHGCRAFLENLVRVVAEQGSFAIQNADWTPVYQAWMHTATLQRNELAYYLEDFAQPVAAGGRFRLGGRYTVQTLWRATNDWMQLHRIGRPDVLPHVLAPRQADISAWAAAHPHFRNDPPTPADFSSTADRPLPPVILHWIGDQLLDGRLNFTTLQDVLVAAVGRRAEARSEEDRPQPLGADDRDTDSSSTDGGADDPWSFATTATPQLAAPPPPPPPPDRHGGLPRPRERQTGAQTAHSHEPRTRPPPRLADTLTATHRSLTT